MQNAAALVPQPASPEALALEIQRLADLPVSDLRKAWTAEFRRPPPKGLWRDLLLRSLAWRLQERAAGGPSKAVLGALEAYGRQKPGQPTLRRLKPGTVLVREVQGVRHTVAVAANGFVWQEKTYESLSAIAKLITGTKWNGPKFFGLREEKTRKLSPPDREAV